MRRRPGTVAIAAAIKNNTAYQWCLTYCVVDFRAKRLSMCSSTPIFGDAICFILRGDKAPQDRRFTPDPMVMPMPVNCSCK